MATTGNYEYNTAQTFTGDYVYAFDADTNGGAQCESSLAGIAADRSVPTPGSYPYQFGVIGTPVIDPSTNTMYLVDAEMQNAVFVHRLHALDITTGAEKFGGPVQIQASVPGTGSGSSNGVLTFNDVYQFQRPALLLLNGVVYIGFGAVNDEGPWHGWLFSYNPATCSRSMYFVRRPTAAGAVSGWAERAWRARSTTRRSHIGRLFLPPETAPSGQRANRIRPTVQQSRE